MKKKHGKTQNKNIVKVCPGPKPTARGLRVEISTFHKIIDTNMVDEIVTLYKYVY